MHHTHTGSRPPNTTPKISDLKNAMNLVSVHPTMHGLRTPDEAFFHQNPTLLGLGRLIGQINFGALEVFLANLSALILAL
jgi:hypothetical protein